MSSLRLCCLSFLFIAGCSGNKDAFASFDALSFVCSTTSIEVTNTGTEAVLLQFGDISGTLGGLIAFDPEWEGREVLDPTQADAARSDTLKSVRIGSQKTESFQYSAPTECMLPAAFGDTSYNACAAISFRLIAQSAAEKKPRFDVERLCKTPD